MFSDVHAHTARTVDRNVTLSQEVPDDSKELGSACPSFNERPLRCVCVSGRKVFLLSAKKPCLAHHISFVYTQSRDAFRKKCNWWQMLNWLDKEGRSILFPFSFLSPFFDAKGFSCVIVAAYRDLCHLD